MTAAFRLFSEKSRELAVVVVLPLPEADHNHRMTGERDGDRFTEERD